MSATAPALLHQSRWVLMVESRPTNFRRESEVKRLYVPTLKRGISFPAKDRERSISPMSVRRFIL